jgi:hypothetical protein
MTSPSANRIKYAIATAAIIGSVGAISVASAASPMKADPSASMSGYNKDQCKHGGWRNFKNPDGSQKFHNQGQCVAFFEHEGNPGPGNHGGGLGQLLSQFFAFIGSFFASIGNLFSNLGSFFRL